MPEETKKKIRTERRRYGRIKKAFKVRLRKFVFPFIESEESWHQGIITNLSACGIFITLQKDFLKSSLQVGDMLHMEVGLGKWNDIKATDKPFDYFYQREPFTVLGKIIRFEENGEKHLYVGIDFIGIDEGQRKSVFRFIRKMMYNDAEEQK